MTGADGYTLRLENKNKQGATTMQPTQACLPTGAPAVPVDSLRDDALQSLRTPDCPLRMPG